MALFTPGTKKGFVGRWHTRTPAQAILNMEDQVMVVDFLILILKANGGYSYKRMATN